VRWVHASDVEGVAAPRPLASCQVALLLAHPAPAQPTASAEQRATVSETLSCTRRSTRNGIRCCKHRHTETSASRTEKKTEQNVPVQKARVLRFLAVPVPGSGIVRAGGSYLFCAALHITNWRSKKVIDRASGLGRALQTWHEQAIMRVCYQA
jgi:hypothetical protein